MTEETTYPAVAVPRPDRSRRTRRIASPCWRSSIGLLLGKAEERISIGKADQTVATELVVAADSPVMVLDRVVHDLDGRPVEWRIGYCHFTDQYYLADIG